MNRLYLSRDSQLPLLARAIGLLLIAVNTGLATPVVVSEFGVDDEGWRVSGDVTSAVPTYFSTGGASNGFVRAFDSVVGGVWYWDAPSKFLGNHSPSYGTPLTYQLRMRGSGPLFEDSQEHTPQEVVETLVQSGDVQIERIISHGHASSATSGRRHERPRHLCYRPGRHPPTHRP